ncbi:S1 RNA-binding domain-containing protein [Candidatus Saganbacteria bacterium]|nr:S1 RNA-binding domain-containing protein [Candidatus Saganbacteria bacterium]
MPLDIGSEVEGKVTGVTNYGAFVDLGSGNVGLVHISQVSDTYVTDINQHLKVGDIIKVKVLGLVKEGKYDLSIKLVGKQANQGFAGSFKDKRKKDGGKEKPQPGSFEDKITQFLKTSEERLLDIKRNIEGKQGTAKKRR